MTTNLIKNNSSAITAIVLAVVAALVSGCKNPSTNPTESVGYDGLAPLHRAAISGDTTELEHLLSIQHADPNLRDIAGVTALHYAARAGHVNAARMLVSYGATPSLATSTGWTPIDLAMRERHIDVVHFLSQYGFNPRGALPDGEPYLVYAVRLNDAKLAEYLLRERIDPNVVIESSGLTLIETAFDAENRELIHLLLNHGARLESNAKVPNPPLHRAVEWADMTLVSRLLTSGADASGTDRHGRTAADLAREKGLTEMADLIDHYILLGTQR